MFNKARNYFTIFLFLILLFISVRSENDNDTENDNENNDQNSSAHENCIENCSNAKTIWPITFFDLLGYISMFLVTIITTVGGIGGGAFYLPIMMVFFGFPLKETIPLSITCVMGVLLARYLMTIKEKHPRRDKPLINYEVCLIFSPSITVGSVFGVLLNRIAPSWLILILVLVVLGSLGVKTFKKALALREAEKIMKGRKVFNLTEQEKAYLMEIHTKIRDLEEENDQLDYSPDKTKNRINHSHYVRQMSRQYLEKKGNSAHYYDDYKANNIEMKNLSKKEEDEADFMAQIQEKIQNIERFEQIYGQKNEENEKEMDNKTPLLDEDVIPPELPEETGRRSVLKNIASSLHDVIQTEAQTVPVKKLYLMLLMLGILIIISLIQGSRHFPSIIGVSFCSLGYWLIRFSFIPIGLIFLLYVVKLLTSEYQAKKKCGYIFLKSDLTYDYQTCMKITLNGVFTGFASAVLGIGGAVFIGPLLLQLGLSPHESTYTASFSALFTALTAFIQYLLTGLIKWDYALVNMIIGICAMYIGLEVILKYVKKMGSASTIVIVLAVVIILSTVLIIVSGVSFMVIDYNKGVDIWSFRPIC